MYWDRITETMDRRELDALQLDRLNRTVERARRSPHYSAKLGERGGKGIDHLEQITDLPFTTKDDLRAGFPYGFVSQDLVDTVRLHSSSGTTGTPTVVFHTAADLDAWADLVARCMHMTGARSGDVFQNMMGYGLFTGGLGFHYGAEKLGMLTIPIGPGNSARQLWFLKTFRTSVIHILPSYALRLAGLMEENAMTLADLNLRIAFIGAEPHTEAMRGKIEEALGIKAYNSYGLSEMCGPGVAFECAEQDGLHLWEDAFYPEIIDPRTLENLPPGEVGELVLTTLTREAMPLIRYRTRDLTSIIDEPCPCGRTHRRISRIVGRSDDMLIINGVNIFPMQIEKVLMTIPEVGHNYAIEVHTRNFMDKVHVKVEINQDAFGGTLSQLEHLQKRTTEALRSELLVTPVVDLVEAGSLPAAQGKAQRVFDLREED